MRNIFKNAKLSLLLLVVVVLLIFLHTVGILKPIENLAVRIFSPIQRGVYALGISINNLYLTVSGSNEPLRVHQEQEKEIQELIVANARLKVQLEESQDLLDQQYFLEDFQFKSISARVIGQNPEPVIQAIILDKGSRHGVAIDMPLITSEGIMVGKIFTVKANSSEAILINDSLSEISALIQNEAQTQGVVIGEHGLSLNMGLIPQNEEIVIDDIVVTAGIEPTIPRGLVIGKVSRVVSEPNNPFQTVRVRSLVRVDKLTVVSILIGPFND